MDALAGLRVVTAAFEDGLRRADLDAGLARTRWTVAELAAHLGEVHRWAALCSRTDGPRPARERAEVEVPPAEWYAQSRRILLSTLDELDPDAPCYTFQRTNRVVRFWHRRQLHETLVHLWDLRSAADPAAPAPPEVPAEVHADGIDELFEVFLPHAKPQERPRLGGAVALHAADVDRTWTLAPDWTWTTTATGAPTTTGTADETVRLTGTAGNLLLALWNRRDHADVLTVHGSAELAAEFAEVWITV